MLYPGGKLLIVALLAFNTDRLLLLSPRKQATQLKWYIRISTSKPDQYTVTIDARKEGRYMEFGKLKFSIGLRDTNGNLLKQDTLDFFTDLSKEKDPYNSLGIIQAGTIITRTFTYPPSGKLTGMKLFYQWHDTSYSTAPDPVEDKVIINEYIFGDGVVESSE